MVKHSVAITASALGAPQTVQLQAIEEGVLTTPWEHSTSYNNQTECKAHI